ncbi:MAG: hypothetical protein JSV74_03030 [Dehalococcoidia bacterium]|nr:MAG: hypothetical protein JSV74_03030 [Dehalococcoidia bacterium]
MIEITFLSTYGLGAVNGEKLNNIMPGLQTNIDNVFTYNDSAALCHQAVQNTLDGYNPYEKSNIAKAIVEFNVPVDNITPLRQGEFAEAFPYPEKEKLDEIWQEAINSSGDIPEELESKLNYPAGGIVMSIPFFLIGLDDVRIIGFLYFLPALFYAILKTPKHLRFILAAAILVSLEFWSSWINGGAGVFVFPFMLLAWILWKKQTNLSALFMGLAISMKQIAWFFLIFYLILIMKTMGIRKLFVVTFILAFAFLAINIPFIIDEPELWVNSIFAPVLDNLFPLGVGIISFISTGFIDIQSPVIFTIMEIIVLLIAAIWYFYNCRRYPYTGLVLALIPLFFAWRSLPAYFLYIDIIILTVIIINEYASKAITQSNKPLSII